MRYLTYILFILILSSCTTNKYQQPNSKRLATSNYFLANSYQVIKSNDKVKKTKEKDSTKKKNRWGLNTGKIRTPINKTKFLTYDFH